MLLFVLVGTIIYLGVALSTRVQLTLALISVTVVFVVLYLRDRSKRWHPPRPTGFSVSSSPNGLKGFFFGVLYGVLLFTGFETSANLAEETDKPERNIPRAVLTSVLVIAGFYIIGTFAQVAGFHFNLKALGGATSAGPLFVLAGPKSSGGFADVGIRRLVELVVIFDMIAVLIGCAVSASRGFFALARDRKMPSPLTKISRRGTPLGCERLCSGGLRRGHRPRRVDDGVRVVRGPGVRLDVLVDVDLWRIRDRGHLSLDRRGCRCAVCESRQVVGVVPGVSGGRCGDRGRHLRSDLQGHVADGLGALRRPSSCWRSDSWPRGSCPRHPRVSRTSVDSPKPSRDLSRPDETSLMGP